MGLPSGSSNEQDSARAATSTAVTLQDLAADILVAANAVTSYCNATGQPQPSTTVNVADLSKDVIPKTAPLDVKLAQQTLLEASARMHQIMTEPSVYVPQLAVYPQHISCLEWICKFGILSIVPLDKSLSYDEVARSAKVPLATLKSVARMAICGGFMQEHTPGHLGHNRLSAHFKEKTALQDWTMFLADGTIPMAMKLSEATEKFGETTSKTETAFNIAMQSDQPFFKYLQSDPKLSKRFAGYMQGVTATQGTSVEHLMNGFDWDGLGAAKIVDVGGSNGHASIALAKAFPQLQFVVQDLPVVVEAAKNDSAELDPSVASRVSFEAHDFFQPQPVTDADVYILRQILHDWQDHDAQAILSQVYRALKPGARILVMDTALPTPGSVGMQQEAQMRVRDLTMRETFNAHEREMEEWVGLCKAVDQRLTIKTAKQPHNSVLTVMEIVVE